MLWALQPIILKYLHTADAKWVYFLGRNEGSAYPIKEDNKCMVVRAIIAPA